MSLDRTAFLTKRELPQEEVFIPALDGTVVVQGMSARQRSSFERQFQTLDGKPNQAKQKQFRERLVVECCVNDAGAKLFTVDDIAVLSDQPAGFLEPIVNKAMELSGMSSGDAEKLAKNSTETKDDG